MTEYDFFITLSKYLGISFPFAIAFFILVILFMNPDKLIEWKGIILGCFAFFSVKADKTKTANVIRGKILRATKELSKENEHILPYDLKIEWVEDETREAFFDDNQIIVRMNRSNDPCKNFVTAVTTFVETGLMPKERRYVEEKMMQATDLQIGRLLLENTFESALNYYNSNVYDPKRTSDNTIMNYVAKLREIDENGMLVTIFLNEVCRVANRIYPSDPSVELYEETSKFLDFLERIALRSNGDNKTPLKFIGKFYKVNIILAAKYSTYYYRGTEYYKEKITKAFNKGINSIYIFGLGSKREITKEIAETAKLEDERIKEIVYHNYVHNRFHNPTKGICAEIILWDNDELI